MVLYVDLCAVAAAAAGWASNLVLYGCVLRRFMVFGFKRIPIHGLAGNIRPVCAVAIFLGIAKNSEQLLILFSTMTVFFVDRI